MNAAFDYINPDVFQSLAWIFTVMSGVASIALTVHKFGLSPGKRILLIFGIIAFGLGVAALLLPGSRWGIFESDLASAKSEGGAKVTSSVDLIAIQQMIATIGPEYVGGLIFEKDGNIRIVFNSTPVERREDSPLYAVEFNDAQKAASGVDKVVAYSGTSFEADIGGERQSMEILQSGGDDVIIATDQGIEVIDTKAAPSDSGMKVERIALAN